MSSNPSTARYSSLSISMHWLMLVLFVLVYASMELKGMFPKGSEPRELFKLVHFSVGILIFALVWLRLIGRLIGPTPAITPQPPLWQTRLAHLVHLALYVLMIGMPLVGWLILNAEGKAVPFFGLELPLLIQPDHDLAENLEELHEAGASLGYLLIAGHAAAAVFHHHFVRDNTLLRMLPGRR